MEHLHRLVWVKRTTFIECQDCNLRLRFASYDEANHVIATDDFLPDGPMFFEQGAIVVPLTYSVKENQ